MSGGLVITQPCLVAGRFESICRYSARNLKSTISNDEKYQVPKYYKIAFINALMDYLVLFDFCHVKGMYEQGFEQKRYLTIPS